MARPVNIQGQYSAEDIPEDNGLSDVTFFGRGHTNTSDQHRVGQSNTTTGFTLTHFEGTENEIAYEHDSISQSQYTNTENHFQRTGHYSSEDYLLVEGGDPVLLADVDLHDTLSSNDQGMNYAVQNREDPGQPLHFNTFGNDLLI